tara:strand:+ start:338 stop:1927 length:1590 start_codon:yes stop_codon:yes gene_type:complete
MTATITTFNAILKEFYVGPVIDALNTEIAVLKHFDKATLDWNGRQAVIPIHTARNSGVSYAAEYAGAANLPTAGRQGYGRLLVDAKYQYGRFEITGPAIASAKNGGKAAFVGWVDAEMNRLTADVKKVANKSMVSGGLTKGFLHERKPLQYWTGAAGTIGGWSIVGAVVNNMPNQFLEYRGDFTPFLGCVSNQPATWVPVNLTRTDTFNPIWRTVAGGTIDIFVTAANTTDGELEITFGSRAGAGGAISTVVKPGFCTALSIRPEQVLNPAGGAPVGVNGATLQANLEPNGLFQNMASGTHYQLGRNSVMDDGFTAYTAGAAPIVRGLIISAAIGTTAGVVAAAGTADQAEIPFNAANGLPRLQQAIDRTKLDGETVAQTDGDGWNAGAGVPNGVVGSTVDGGGGDVNLMFMNPVMRQKYVSTLQGNLTMTTNVGQSGPTSKGDVGILEVGYSGIPMHVSRDVPNGMICFLKADTWTVAELESGKFADLDGDVISRVAGSDAWEGFYKWYYNLVCKKPNDNVILTGWSL